MVAAAPPMLDESALTGEAAAGDRRAGERGPQRRRQRRAGLRAAAAAAAAARAPTPASCAWSRRRRPEGAVRAPRRSLRARLPAADAGARRRSPGCVSGDPSPGARRAGRRHALPADPGRPGRLRRRHLARGPARRHGQGRRRARGARPRAHACCSTRPARSRAARRVVADRAPRRRHAPDELLRARRLARPALAARAGGGDRRPRPARAGWRSPCRDAVRETHGRRRSRAASSGRRVAVGAPRLRRRHGSPARLAARPRRHGDGDSSLVAVDGEPAGRYRRSRDEIRADAPRAIRRCARGGVRRVAHASAATGGRRRGGGRAARARRRLAERSRRRTRSTACGPSAARAP